MTTLLPALPTGTWTVEPAETVAQFRARDVVRKTVVGSLAVLTGRVEVSPQGVPLHLAAELDLSSVETGNRKRDGDLRGPRFFDASRDPSLTVTAGPAEIGDDGRWHLSGELAMKGRSCPVDLTVDVVDLRDGRAEVRATAALDRRALGITVPRLLVGHAVLVDVHAVLRGPAA